MSWQHDIEPFLRRDEPLSARTTFGIGGPAAFFVEPPGEEEFSCAYAAARRSGLPVLVLGGGSNLLISDEGVRGIILSTSRLNGLIGRAHGRVRVPAGTGLPRLVRWAESNGLAGMECLAGIPGTVGGAVCMNAGGRDGTIGNMVSVVRCVGRHGELVERRGRDVRWAYRSSDISEPIVAVELLLRKDKPEAIRNRVKATIWQKRKSQPVERRSAGCFFKNPAGASAGALIDKAGMKGERVGMACVSTRHANFIVNLGYATSGDVLALCRKVRERIHERFGLQLESEVRLWPSPSV